MYASTQVLFWSAIMFYLAVVANNPVLAAPAGWLGFWALITILFGDASANKLFDVITLHQFPPRHDPSQREKVIAYMQKEGFAPEESVRMYEKAIIETGLLIHLYNRMMFRPKPSQ